MKSGALLLLLVIGVGLLSVIESRSPAASDNLHGGCDRPPRAPVPSLITDPLPSSYVDRAALPDDYDWRSVNGLNYLTTVGNQFMPKYCG